MDIVDAFTHLIPEHLDDALFLGSNLENDGCDELIPSHNVIEDSLKNMLSDKDPMLGSASTQFCLPVLDSTDPNFQLTCPTVVGLDDIMDEACVKESAHVTIDEDDLLLPSRNLRHRLDTSTIKSSRKSPRLIVQDPVRSLQQFTVAKCSNTAPVSPKETPAESESILALVQKGETDLKPNELIKGEAEDFILKPEEPKVLRRSCRRISQTEEGTEVLLPLDEKSRTIDDEFKKEAKADIKVETNLQEESEVKSDVFSSCSLVLDPQPPSEELESQNKAVIGTQFESAKSNNVQNMVEHETLHLMATRTQSEGDGDYKIDEISLRESSSCELSEIQSNKTFVNLGKGHDDIALLPDSVGEESECSPWLETPVESMGKNAMLVNEYKLEALDGAKDEGRNASPPEMCSAAVELTRIDINRACSSDKAETSVDAQDLHLQEVAPCKGGAQVKRSAKSKVHSGSKSSKGMKKAKSKPTKSVVQPLQNATAGAQGKCTLAPKGMIDTKSHTIHVKVVRPVRKQSPVKSRPNTDEHASQLSVKPGKGRKLQSAKAVKMHCSATGDKVATKQTPTVVKKSQQTQGSKQLTHISDDRAKSHQSSPSESRSSVSVHTRLQLEHTAHSNQKQIPKQQSTPLKTSDQARDEGETKDSMGVERSKEEEKLKLKKALPPRQRRSSKSVSVDEPPLFIPDNIGAVKKDGSDHIPPGDGKNVWLHGKQCLACKKNHVHRFMVGCGRCDDWFHGECVGLSLSQAQQMRDDGKEYLCVKCSADEEKIESCDRSTLDNQDKTDAHLENRTIQCENSAISKETLSSVPSGEKSKQMEETVKHKVKTFRKDSGDGRSAPEGKELESKKVHGATVKKTLQTPAAPHLSPEEKNDKLPKHPTVSLSEEKSLKSGPLEKPEAKKQKTEKKVQVSISATPSPKPSSDQIRQSVRHTLQDILLKRLSESSAKIPEERAAKVATKIEKELFSFYRDIDSKYKSKYRSLTFNLRDPKNNVLYKRVLKGDISAEHLIRMSPEELASKELAAWRQRENRHTIEMIEKEQREVERRPITKITHKGEIEIESETSLKEAEAMETEEPTAAKPVEKVEEIPKEKVAIPESASDSTNQHKVHLFDLNCKICTGRMAPPSDDLSPKKVKVAIGVARKHSDNESESMEEDIATALSTASSILSSDVLETEKPESPKSVVSSPVRSEKPVAGEDESAFLARLSYIWKGIVNMPSVAKFLIKAYPVSGSLEYLTEDLPDSIQVGGRISPQTVWDYVEKIKATGTKETCLIRFCPVTEEDQISYTLLYAYFSSRKRYGVVANNTRQVKDMYLIPLGASEKVPRFLVPFDGPGLEAHRPNLLLALIIRQKLKRSHSTSLDEESLGKTPDDVTPEKRTKKEISEEEGEEEADEDNDFFNSFTTVLHKSRNRSQDSDTDEPQTVEEPVPVKSKSEPPKPLRFLPGVLVGWENQSSTLELANKPLPVDDILQSLLGSTENIFECSELSLDEQSVLNEDKRADELTSNSVSETKAKHNDPQESSEVKRTVASPVVSSLYATRTVKGLSLKGKPPDVSTEAFLANLAYVQSQGEEIVKNKGKEAKRQLDDQQDLHEAERTANSSFSASTSGKGNGDTIGNLAPSEATGNPSRSTKFVYVKRDPRQAAGRKQLLNASDVNASDCSKNEESQNLQCRESSGEEGLHHMDSLKSEMSSPLSANRGTDHLRTSQKERETLLQNMETLHSYGEGPAGVLAHLETGNTTQNDFILKDQSSTTGEIVSPARHQPSIFQSPKSCPSLLQFQSPPNYPPMYGFPPHMPPPLIPPGYAFPRGPSLRFRSLDSGLQTPMVPWPPGVHFPGHPSHYIGPLSHRLPLAPGQPRYLGEPQFYQRNDHLPGRRYSDPWDSHDLYLDRGFSRGSEVQRSRQRFYSDSHHQRKKRLHERESSNDKYRDRDSERNRRRERERSQEKDRERKGRDESHRDKDRSRVPRSDRSTDSKTHKESKNADKSKHEHTREKERGKSRDRTREGEKDKEKHHKDKDQSDREKHKR